MKTLAQSKNFIVGHEYETVWLVHADGQKTVIGDFYGDPQCALIDREERWYLVADEGVIVYWLHEPFDEYRRGESSRQYQEFLREPKQGLSVDKLTQISVDSVSSKADSGETYNISLDSDGHAAVQLQC